MKKALSLLLFILLLGNLWPLVAQDIPPKPDPPRLVNDFAGALNEEQRQTLENKLVSYDDTTSTQITIAIVKTTGDYPIADYALALGRNWGVGQQGKNNGIVILWANEDREVYIATGYGLEGAVPDAIARRIVDNVIIPHFKQEQFYEGLSAGVDAIVMAAKGEYQAEPTDDSSGFPLGLIMFVAAIVILFLIFASRNSGGGKGNRNRGGGVGPVFWPYTTYGGGGSGSGSWGGGGGGFGGFGGGSFGGGGAGGSY